MPSQTVLLYVLVWDTLLFTHIWLNASQSTACSLNDCALNGLCLNLFFRDAMVLSKILDRLVRPALINTPLCATGFHFLIPFEIGT